MSPLDRFLALTLCIEQAVQENRLHELPSLIAARGAIIQELAASGQPIPEDRMASVQEADRRLMAGLKARRGATLERINQIRSLKNARSAYSRGF